MNIEVNGKPLEIVSTTLAELLRELDYEGLTVATALNHEFVRKAERGTVVLKDGDEVEILVPRQGG
jgi:sulfur carrier protein